MLSAANNKITGYFPIVRGMAPMTLITVNNGGANERWKLVLEPKQGRSTFRGSNNDFRLKFGITLLDQPNESCFDL